MYGLTRSLRARRDLLILIGIVLAGLGLRALYLRELVESPAFSAPPVDPGFHDYWARALVTGDWTTPEDQPDPQIRTTPYFRPPGYPYFLTLIYSVTGPNYLAPRVAQMSLGLLNVVVGFLFARKWYGAGVGLVCAALLSTYWAFIYYEGAFQEPVLLIFTLVLFLSVLALYVERLAFRHTLIAGIFLGLAALVKPNGLLFLPVALLWTFWVAYRRRKGLRAYLSGFGLVLGTVLAIAPATIRNYWVARDLVLISSNFGINLFIGNNEYADGLFLSYIPGFGHFRTCYDYPGIVESLEAKLGRPLKYSEASAYFAGEGLRYVRDNPSRAARLTIKRAALFWTPDEIAHNTVIDPSP
jgi:hypothetical protein